jgi:5'-3' exonuclease
MLFISYYPTWDLLDSIIEDSEAKQINIFIDLKNCLSGLYMENSIKTMLDVNSNTKTPIADIFNSWLDFVSFFYKYMNKRKANIHLYHISDSGDSLYHRNLLKTYKENRTITKFNTMSILEKDTTKKIIRQNFEAIHNAAKKLYNNHSIDLKHFESDFVGHYLIREYFQDEKYLNIIFSRDTDMFQTLKFDNTKIFYRNSKEDKLFYDKNNWVDKYKKEKFDISFPVDNFLYLKCVAGDTADDIPGLKNIGMKKAYNVLKKIERPLEGIEDLKNKLEQIDDKNAKRFLEEWDIIERNYKLISFDEISKHTPYPVVEILTTLDTHEKFNFGESVLFINKINEKLGV